MNKLKLVMLTVITMLFLTACQVELVNEGAGEKVKDLEYTILSEDRMPEELIPLLEERMDEPFEMTYSDKEFIYICIGYGYKSYSGHSVVINELFLAENGILIDTSLLGPVAGAEKMNTPQYPYIVIKTEWIEELPLYTK